MDFTTDDNSWRTAQAAADFTGVLQARLAGEPDIDWVERAQLDRAREELELSTMDLMRGQASLSRGRWVRADWMITGQFALNEKNEHTLSLEITDLEHADVLASSNVVLETATKPGIVPQADQIVPVANALRNLLKESRRNQQAAAGKVRVAPLFLVDASGSPFPGRSLALEKDFFEVLERAAASNANLKLIHFPKAFRSTEESEMVLGGLAGTNPAAWQPAADLFVWGSYAHVQQTAIGKPVTQQIEIELHFWDGASPPSVVKEIIPGQAAGSAPPENVHSAMTRLGNEITAKARKSSAAGSPIEMRKALAGSLLELYDRMTLGPGMRANLGLNDSQKFLQAVELLETACYFDPMNAKARALYITCRWGFWMEFGFKVKNEFWSKLRRSDAWGRYVSQFGLKLDSVELPFPVQGREGMALAYLSSLSEVLAMFPDWHSAEEMVEDEKWRRQGGHSASVTAEYHGFPREMPPELVVKWRHELQTEHGKRVNQICDFIAMEWKPEGRSPPAILSRTLRNILEDNQPAARRLALVEKIWPKCVETAHTFGREWIVGSEAIANEEKRLLVEACNQAGQSTRADELWAMLSKKQTPQTSRSLPADQPKVTAPARKADGLIPTPAWVRELHNFRSMFQLFPPNALPAEVHPTAREIQFPAQSEIQSIVQLAFLDDALLVLAMEERSSAAGGKSAEVSADFKKKRNRLWSLKPGDTGPALYRPEVLPQHLTAILPDGDDLWVAGETTGRLNSRTGQFRKYGLADGLDISVSETIGKAGGRFYAAGDFFKVSATDGAHEHWSNVPLPPASLSHGYDFSVVLAGNREQIAYLAGSFLICDLTRNTWTNVALPASVTRVLGDDSGFWLGEMNGLHFYERAGRYFKHWTGPATINSPFMFLPVSNYGGNPKMPESEAEKAGEQIHTLLKKLNLDRRKAHGTNSAPGAEFDALNLNWRIPGKVTALANDGEFLWAAFESYFGNYLCVIHKMSDAVAAYYRMPPRGSISSLAVSKTSIWVGIAYGDQKLLELPKDPFLSVPRDRWLSLKLSPDERGRLIRSLNNRDQAMYAFYSANDAKVAELLRNADPNKASLEELFSLAFSYDAGGLDKPQLARTWFEAVIMRFPDSPWADFARAAIAENNDNHNTRLHERELLAKYDLNHDGVLDASEIEKMKASPEYQQDKSRSDSHQLDDQIVLVMKKFDQNKDGKLDANELNLLRTQALLFSEMPPEQLAGRKVIVAPFMSKRFPQVSDALKKYDAKGRGGLDAEALRKLAQDLQEKK